MARIVRTLTKENQERRDKLAKTLAELFLSLQREMLTETQWEKLQALSKDERCSPEDYLDLARTLATGMMWDIQEIQRTFPE